MKRVTIVANRSAGALCGTGSALQQLIDRELSKRAIEVQVRFVPGHELGPTTRSALDRGADAVIAAGGDGTVSTMATELVGSGVPMGILPLGTMNHFARDMSLPLELEAAARIIAGTKTRLVDVAEVNARYFINNSSIGTYPAIVQARETGKARALAGKKAATIVAGCKTFFRLPLIHARLRLDGQVLSRLSPFVFVGNNVYTLRLGRAELRERLDAGVLSVITTRSQTAIGLIGLAWLAFCNRLQESVMVEAWQTEQVEIRTRRRHVHVSLDGEVCILTNPLRYRVHPGALRVIVSG